ncbi:MAG: calcium/sodium antiporter [Candidatus Paceibacterota bacterium]
MILVTILLLIVGLAILIAGADILVRGTASISKKYGIAPIVIGLTVVSFGTSAPELVINLISATNGSPDLAIGNILGSNISNILLILGISALFVELKVKKSTTWKEIPFAALSIIALAILGNDVFLDGAIMNSLTRTDGLILLGFFSIFMYYIFELFKNSKNTEPEDQKIKTYSMGKSVAFTILGIVGLIAGGQLLVSQATILATLAGMSEMLIGLTVVAVGTSLPELATSVVAAIKGQSDIAIGNVVGSNIFNVFWILGVTSVVTPLSINQFARQDIMINLAVTVLLFAFLFIGKKHTIQKWQGVVLILLYVLYTIFIIMRG